MKDETYIPPLYDHEFVTLNVLFTKLEDEEEYNNSIARYNELMEEWENKDPELQKIQIEDKPAPPKPNIVRVYQDALFNISDMIISHIHQDKGEDNETVVKVYYSSRTSSQVESMVVLGELKDFIKVLKENGAKIK